MFNLQGSEIIVILLLALVVLGPEKLPDAIRRFSQTYAELKKMGTGFQSELKSALDEPVREIRETADLVMNAADPQKLADEAEAEVAARARAKAVDEPIDERAFLVTDPGAERSDAEGGAPVPPAKPVNQIAAANSSASLAAAAAASIDDDSDPQNATIDPDADVDADVDATVAAVGDWAPPTEPFASPGAAAASGPAFHSAAPPAQPPATHANGADPDPEPGRALGDATDAPDATDDTDATDAASEVHGTEANEEATAS